MPKFQVEQYERHIATYEVEAPDPASAIAQILSGVADTVVEAQYCDVDEKSGMSVSENPGLVRVLRERKVCACDDFIPSIRSVTLIEGPMLAVTNEEKLTLATSLYQQVYHNTDSFEVDDIGTDLAYLMGAILEGHPCEWSRNRAFVEVLRGIYLPEHMIWQYIQFEKDDDAEVPGEDLSPAEELDRSGSDDSDAGGAAGAAQP